MIGIVALVAVMLGSKFCFREVVWPEMLLGWAMATANFYLGVFLKKQSFKNTEPPHVFLYGLFFNGLRAVVLLAAVFLVLRRSGNKGLSFIFSFFVSYFIFLFYYVVALWRAQRQ